MTTATGGSVLTAIVGSYPKPRYIYSRNGRSLLDSFGYAFEGRRTELGPAEFARLLDRAALDAIKDQNRAGIDIVTDGEQRRGHYVLHIVNRLGGVDAWNRKTISMRGGTSTQEAPRVIGKLAYAGPMVVDEFLFTSAHAKGIAKICLPGPSTVADCVADEFYGGDRKRLAFDYADAIHHEVAALVAAGCRMVQFDDPVLLRHPDAAQAWGLEALERCFAGLENSATFAVHICRGYPNKPLERKGISYKANQDYYRDVLAWLSASLLDVVSIEGAACDLDVSMLSAIGTKSVMLGVIDVGENEVESVDSLVARANHALRYLPSRQLILAPDCGMLELTRASASAKLVNLSMAARRVNEACSSHARRG
ncbi:MAG: cobalamin-independent methionine synthase II family protein [Betaproteobacteria bacterium]